MSIYSEITHYLVDTQGKCKTVAFKGILLNLTTCNISAKIPTHIHHILQLLTPFIGLGPLQIILRRIRFCATKASFKNKMRCVFFLNPIFFFFFFLFSTTKPPFRNHSQYYKTHNFRSSPPPIFTPVTPYIFSHITHHTSHVTHHTSHITHRPLTPPPYNGFTNTFLRHQG